MLINLFNNDIPRTSYVANAKNMDTANVVNSTVNIFKIMNKILDFIKSKPLIAGLIGLGIVLLFFPKVLKGLFGGSPRRRHRRNVRRAIGAAPRRRRIVRRSLPALRRRAPRRSRSRSGKKPWQIKGSLAARRRMAQIRRRR